MYVKCCVSGESPLSQEPTVLGDTFARLWDGVERDLVCSRYGEELLEDRNWRGAKAALAQRISETGWVPDTALELAEKDQGERLRLMLALDEALAPVWPGWGSPVPPALVPTRSYWARHGRLSGEPQKVGGAVLIRHVRPQRPEGPAELETVFNTLVRIDPTHWKLLEHRSVPSALDFASERTARGALTIAVCPFAADLQEFEVYKGRRARRSLYRLAGRDCPTVRERVRRLIPILDRSGADIAVLPEGILSPSLRELWVTELQNSFRRRPRESSLRWILIGTGPAEPGSTRNTAVVLHRSGTEIGRQDKRFPFRFTQAADWKLEDVVEPNADEDIERGGLRLIIESEFGRVAVTICEDLSRPLVFENGLRQASPSLLLVPVFNMPFGDYSWARAGSKDVLLDIGTRVVVINSLAVASRWPHLDPCYALGTFRTQGPNSYDAECERRNGSHPVHPPRGNKGLTTELFHLTPPGPDVSAQ